MLVKDASMDDGSGCRVHRGSDMSKMKTIGASAMAIAASAIVLASAEPAAAMTDVICLRLHGTWSYVHGWGWGCIMPMMGVFVDRKGARRAFPPNSTGSASRDHPSRSMAGVGPKYPIRPSPTNPNPGR